MDDPDALCALVRELCDALTIPVLCKIRVFSGAAKPTVDLAQRLQRAGCSVLTVHGRTRNQAGKTGKQCRALADWSKIRAVKQGVQIPVVVRGIECRPCLALSWLLLVITTQANGNVRVLADAEACLRETGKFSLASRSY